MRSKRAIHAIWAMWLLTGMFILLLEPPFAHAHDPKRRSRKPTKAAAALKEARSKMDAAKARLAAAGKYRCCMKSSCDLCARTGGVCECAASVASGHGTCGECLEGWKAGLGTVKGVDPKAVTLLAASSRPVDEALKRINELVLAREAMNTAKRTLVAEGNYSCCIRGGCDSCAHEADCPCGTNLVNPPVAAQNGKKGESGICGECLDGWHSGLGAFQGVELSELKMAEMEMEMPSSFGVGTMFRQGSGTSWLPESTPMYAFMKESGSWMWMVHPLVYMTYSNQSGPRGDHEVYSGNWFMASAQREVKGLTAAGPGTLLFRGMFSLEPATAGGDGYPLLFQTGETFKGLPLTDRQHPHDFIMELAVAYSAPVTKKTVVSLYVAPMGEPALGPPAYPHRTSALDNPEAPIGHHWQDSSHISAGVVTLGVAQDRWKLEASVFTGREPDEKRWNFERPRFDSWATRLSISPHPDWSMQVSYGSLRQPEAIEPGVDVRRMTASVSYQRPIGDRSYLASTFVWGRNFKRGDFFARNYGTNAFLAESCYSWRDRASLFGRYERVEKDELFAAGEHTHEPLIFPINRFTIGGVYDLPLPGAFAWGIGSSFGFHKFPEVLKLFYGERPLSATVFLRFRAKRFGSRESN